MGHTRRLICVQGFAALALLAPCAYAATDLSITKAGSAGVKPGANLAFTIVVTNAGPDAVTDATVSDPTPAGLTFVSTAGDCTTAFPCLVGAIPAGQKRTITATFAVPAGYAGPDPIANTASVSSSTPDTDPANDSTTAETAITRVAGFFALPPCRVVDTRGASGALGGPALFAGAARAFSVRKRCGLPDNAEAVSYNVTVTASTGAGDLRICPGGTTAPLSSAVNYLAGQTRANNGIVPLGADGSIAVQCDQASGFVEMILDVNGYFASNDAVSTAAGPRVSVRPAPEAEINFDNVGLAGNTAVRVLEFADNRPGVVDQSLHAFFPPGSPLRALLPNVVVPSFVVPLGKGGPAGPPTFLLTAINTTAKFTRTAEFHGIEHFRLGWDPPCRFPADPTQEPRTFYARDPRLGEPSLVEEAGFGGPVFVDISSGCGSNKGSGWNFSLYLTARDTRTPAQIASYMLQRMQDALNALSSFITNAGVASQLTTEVGAAITALGGGNAATALSNVNGVIGLVDSNPAAFDNSARNVAGELVGRAHSARYMIQKLVPLGAIVEFPIPTPASQTYEVTTGGDGNLWFGEGIGRIGRLTPAGVFSEFFMQTSSGLPGAIAGGPDGNVWFTLWNGNRIGRITPAGVVTEFVVPTPASYPRDITAGPDGNLWFVERDGNKVGRITPAGLITEFPVPTPGSNPLGIAAGSDGNLWFVENVGNKVGRITTAGLITEFPLSTPSSGPGTIALGPDDNLWFAQWSTKRIGRITPAGTITEIAMPAGGDCHSIATGADGNLWITDLAGDRLWRLTTAGAFTPFPIPTTGALLWGVTSGPDGNIWFAERTANKIGRLVP